jgi:hypothetical protein
MWDDAQLNINAANMHQQNLLREAEQRRLVKAMRQYQSGSEKPGIVAQLRVVVARFMTPSAPKSEARRVHVNS